MNRIASFFHALFINFRESKSILKIESVINRMNLSEKIIFYIASIFIVISGISLLIKVNNNFLVEVPVSGGKFTEGLIGSPRFINPILAISDTDKDLSTLIYSGLMRPSKDGDLILDLAESYEIKDNGLIYDFKIKNNAYFHDGKPVTSDDIIFTINKIIDPVIKSPKKINWDGIVVEKINNKEIRFNLKRPYTPFLENLTIGILPKHVWERVSSEEFAFSDFNIKPIGSGPYGFEKISRNSSGIPTSISFTSFKKYTNGQPKINSIEFNFFQNENDLYKAYQDGSIDSLSGFSPKIGKEILRENKKDLKEASLPRVFGLFFNQNIATVFLDPDVRLALNMSAPRDIIINDVLYGFGNPLNGPTPENIEKEKKDLENQITEAKLLLEKNGWLLNENGILEKKTKNGNLLLSFSISTSNTEELKKTANILKENWQKIGAKIDIKIFEAGDLSQNIIRGRKYDALLFGEVISDGGDLYPFWHSSQRIDPGLNVALYANITVDKILEEIQKEIDKDIKITKKEEVINEIKKDIPAVFLFAPKMIYVKAPNVKNVNFKKVATPNERFVNIEDWFIETNKVWSIFAKI